MTRLYKIVNKRQKPYNINISNLKLSYTLSLSNKNVFHKPIASVIFQHTDKSYIHYTWHRWHFKKNASFPCTRSHFGLTVTGKSHTAHFCLLFSLPLLITSKKKPRQFFSSHFHLLFICIQKAKPEQSIQQWFDFVKRWHFW